MKKLEKKVFYVLILIFTAFLITILLIFNAQSYTREKKNIENNLMKMGNPMKLAPRDRALRENIEEKENEDKESERILGNNVAERKIFMDSVLYTVKYDDDKNILEVVTHSDNEVAIDEIKDVASNILDSDSDRGFKIGNIYFQKYSYSFKDNNQLIIVENGQANQRLCNEIITSLVIAVILELIIIIVSKKLTKWMIKPATEALTKQKQFIADASHELKTPVAVIMASSEALESDYQKKWIDNIKNEAERMNNLITNLLDLSKLENTADKSSFASTNISKIVENSCLTFESLMYERNIKFISNIEENINYKCDSSQIKQLVSIIMDNAIKHCEKNGEIIVNLGHNPNELILEIKNNGKAIPNEIREKIFERFYRADESRSRNENRYGLGLAIAKSIVENHGGKITANSENGFTTFNVVFKN